MTVEECQMLVTPEDLQELQKKFQADLLDLRQQIGVLQARAAALEMQIARIEPMVEARANRTEKLVMELQVEMCKLTKTIAGKEAKELGQYAAIESALKTLLERTE